MRMMMRSTDARTGFLYGLSAYVLWGILPAYFKLVRDVASTEVVAQRVIWSVIFLALLLAFRKSFPQLRLAMANRHARNILIATAALIGTNWLIFIWAVNNGHVLAASLGYYLNPLLNVAVGMMVLKERLTRAQMIAVGFAAAGVTVLATGNGGGALWISLSLALTFCFYGLLRKIAPVESLEGLSIETLILLPIALAYVGWLTAHDRISFGNDLTISLLLMAGGVVTAVPLLLFAAAARRMPYATLGLLQYIAPTLQFLLAVVAYGEALTTAHILCFVLIWIGLIIFASDTLRMHRAARQPA